MQIATFQSVFIQSQYHDPQVLSSRLPPTACFYFNLVSGEDNVKKDMGVGRGCAKSQITTHLSDGDRKVTNTPSVLTETESPYLSNATLLVFSANRISNMKGSSSKSSS